MYRRGKKKWKLSRRPKLLWVYKVVDTVDTCKVMQFQWTPVYTCAYCARAFHVKRAGEMRRALVLLQIVPPVAGAVSQHMESVLKDISFSAQYLGFVCMTDFASERELFLSYPCLMLCSGSEHVCRGVLSWIVFIIRV